MGVARPSPAAPADYAGYMVGGEALSIVADAKDSQLRKPPCEAELTSVVTIRRDGCYTRRRVQFKPLTNLKPHHA
jgi:hypothetical protein